MIRLTLEMKGTENTLRLVSQINDCLKNVCGWCNLMMTDIEHEDFKITVNIHSPKHFNYINREVISGKSWELREYNFTSEVF